MVRIKKFLESVEHGEEIISELEDFFVYSHLGEKYDIEIEKNGGYQDLGSGRVRVKNIAKVVILNSKSIGIGDFIEDIKQTISMMEKLSDYSVCIVAFTDYGFYNEYEDMINKPPGPKLKTLIEGNLTNWRRIVLLVYNKTLKISLFGPLS